jgi:hypothetical protein
MNKVNLGKLFLGHSLVGQPIIGELDEKKEFLHNALVVMPSRPRTKEEALAHQQLAAQGKTPLELAPVFASMTLEKSAALSGVPEALRYVEVKYPVDKLVTLIPIDDIALGRELKNMYFEAFNTLPEPPIDVTDIEAADRAMTEKRNVEKAVKEGSKLVGI